MQSDSGPRAMENAWDALRKGSALEVLGRLVLEAYSVSGRPARIPALARMRVLDLQVPLQRRHSGGSGSAGFKPAESTGFAQVLSPPEKHVLAVFRHGAGRRAGGAEARSEPAPFENPKNLTNKPVNLLKTKDTNLRNPSSC